MNNCERDNLRSLRAQGVNISCPCFEHVLGQGEVRPGNAEYVGHGSHRMPVGDPLHFMPVFCQITATLTTFRTSLPGISCKSAALNPEKMKHHPKRSTHSPHNSHPSHYSHPSRRAPTPSTLESSPNPGPCRPTQPPASTAEGRIPPQPGLPPA